MTGFELAVQVSVAKKLYKTGFLAVCSVELYSADWSQQGGEIALLQLPLGLDKGGNISSLLTGGGQPTSYLALHSIVYGKSVAKTNFSRVKVERRLSSSIST